MFKAKTIIIVLIVFFLLIVISKKASLFIGNNEMIDPLIFENPISAELASSQLDCTLFDNTFHEECIGFNGCEDNNFLRNQDYCEQNSDCSVNFACCSIPCSGSDCFQAKFCDVANNQFISAHNYGCANVECTKEVSCKEALDIICQNNGCKIKI